MSARGARGNGTPAGGSGGGGGGGAPSGAAGGDLGSTYPNPTVTNITVGSDAAGDLYYRSAGNVLVRLPKGTAGQALIETGATPLPVWGNDFGAQNLVTTGTASTGALTATSAAVSGALSVGAATVASAGDVRLNTAGTLLFRNNANSADVIGFLKNGDSLAIGTDFSLTRKPSALILGSGGNMTFYAGGLTSAVVVLASTGLNIDAGAPAAWTHSPQTSNVATKDWTITSNGPFASATGTNRNPGNLLYKVPAAASGGTEGSHQFFIAAAVHGQFDGTIADTETALLVRRNVGGSFTLQRVTMGAADSGGSGFKVLRVPN